MYKEPSVMTFVIQDYNQMKSFYTIQNFPSNSWGLMS